MGMEFTHTLEALPKLRSLRLGRKFNQIVASWPNSLEAICFGRDLKQTLASLPKLRSLTIGQITAHWASVRELTLGFDFNESVREVEWPGNLRSLTLGPHFNQPMSGVNLPSCLQTLIFGTRFNQDLQSFVLPHNLQCLSPGDSFNKPVQTINFPEGGLVRSCRAFIIMPGAGLGI